MVPNLTDGLQWYLVFVFSTTVHEAAHAWSALKLGDDTAYRGGQVTLDPTPHIRRSPIGMVVMPILSYVTGGWMIGWASAPFDPDWAIRYPRRSALMAAAGPASNLALLLISAILIHVGIFFHVFEAPEEIIGSAHITDATRAGIFQFLAQMLSIGFSLNLILAVFNLIPLPPLDGSAILMFFCTSETAEKFFHIVRHPNLSLVGLFISWRVMDLIFPPIKLLAINLLYPGAGYH